MTSFHPPIQPGNDRHHVNFKANAPVIAAYSQYTYHFSLHFFMFFIIWS